MPKMGGVGGVDDSGNVNAVSPSARFRLRGREVEITRHVGLYVEEH
jgi:hypothetical protein